jgi:hypothetical protein
MQNYTTESYVLVEVRQNQKLLTLVLVQVAMVNRWARTAFQPDFGCIRGGFEH